MSRPGAYTIAAALMVLYSLVSLVLGLPDLTRGAVDAMDSPPFVLVLISFAVAILGFASAYGVLRVEKWGVVLTIVLCAFNILTSLPAVIAAPDPALRALGVVGIVWAAAIVVLLLRPTSRTATA